METNQPPGGQYVYYPQDGNSATYYQYDPNVQYVDEHGNPVYPVQTGAGEQYVYANVPVTGPGGYTYYANPAQSQTASSQQQPR